MVFYWSRRDSKSPHVSRTLLSIRTDLLLFGWSLIIVWFLTLPSLCRSFWAHQSQLVSPWPHVPQFFFLFSDKVKVLVSLFIFFDFYSFFFFFLTIMRFDLLAWIRWSVCISKSQRILFISFSRTHSGLCTYHLFIESNYHYYWCIKSIFFTDIYKGNFM